MHKLFLFCAACLMGVCAMAEVQLKDDALEEIDAVSATQNNTTTWFRFGGQDKIHVTIDGQSVAFPEKTYNLTDGAVETTFGAAPADEWFTLRTGVTSDNWNTICMDKNITAIEGATFWNVVAEKTNEFELEQVFEPQAGYGYIIYYTANELKVKYGNETATEPVEATEQHPIQGIYEAITDYDQEGKNALTGNYVVYQNELCKVTGWVTMADHRAYVVAELAPKQAPAPSGAPRMTMAKPNSTPTSLGGKAEGLRGEKAIKVLNDGQFVIIRDNKMYNAQGIEL